MEREDRTTIDHIDVAMAVIAHEAVDCFCGREQSVTDQPKKLVSSTGGSFFGLQGENWPTTKGGEPLIPWLQVVCTEIRGVGGAFYNRQSVCFYLRQDFYESEAIAAADAADFVVREYSLDDELQPLLRPSEVKEHPFRQVLWKQEKDYPSLSKYDGLFHDDVYTALCKTERFPFENRSGIKIGGWPTPVQRDQDYPGSCDLQIDMTENYMYGDSGIGYLTRTSSGWHVIFECC